MASEIQDLSEGSTTWVLSDDGTLVATGVTASGLTAVSATTVTGTTVSGTNVSATNVLATTYRNASGQIQQPICVNAVVGYSDTSPVTLFTVPAGAVAIITDVIVVITEEWNGSSADLDIGIVGGDTDGYIDGATLTAAAVTGANHDERGVLLYDSGNAHDITDFQAAATVIGATVTPGSGASAGEANVVITGWLVPAP